MASLKPHMFISHLFLACLIIPSSPSSLGYNLISFNSSLSGNNTISSPAGKFELGFFQLGNKSASSNYYLGIWYKKVSQLTPVWIANRNAPISDPNSSELKILTTGNLALLDQNKTQIWSTNVTSMGSTSIICTLLDTGNLVLKYSSDQSATYLWQSMDYPTNTWLPGGKLGRSKSMGPQSIISWKNADDPSEGIFSLEMDPNGSSQYFIYWNRSKQYWTSGEWNGKFFNNVPEMNSNYLYSFEYVTNENESYFTYSLQDDSIISRFVMDLSGQIKQLTWLEESQQWLLLWTQPPEQCNVYALCGPFGICDANSLPYCTCLRGFEEVNSKNWELKDSSEGCQRDSPLQCGLVSGSSSKGGDDRFYEMSGIHLPDNPHLLNNASAKDCERACQKNCSCSAYAYNGSNCLVWYYSLLNLYQETDGSTGNALFFRLSASEFKKTNHMKKEIIFVFLGFVTGIVACIVVIVLLTKLYQRCMFFTAMRGSETGLVAFRFRDLQRITNNFSERLGGGSFGSVFKGTLPNSCSLAVKKLERILQSGEKQFRNEVSTIGILQHINLVRLRGFCCEGDKRLLVYDYMPNGSLDKQLFGRNSSHMNWNIRYQIALGAARGLAYLHESCVDCIIHCDVKPENILLDELFIPKVADFGMAKLVGRDFSRVITTMRGTIGYLAPEWISGIAITTKIDVYSYGQVLFELISGRRNSDKLKGKTVDYFPLLACIELNKGNIHALLDPNLIGDVNLEEFERVCRVACWCIQDEEYNRPTMVQVVQILESSLEVRIPPIPRSLKATAENPGSLEYFIGHSFKQNCPSDSSACASTITEVSQ